MCPDRATPAAAPPPGGAGRGDHRPRSPQGRQPRWPRSAPASALFPAAASPRGPGGSRPGQPRRQEAKPRLERGSPSHARPRRRSAGARSPPAGPALPPPQGNRKRRTKLAPRAFRRRARPFSRELGGAWRSRWQGAGPRAVEDTGKMAAAAAALRLLAPGLRAPLRARLPPQGRAAGRPLQQRRGFRLSAPTAAQVARPPRGRGTLERGVGGCGPVPWRAGRRGSSPWPRRVRAVPPPCPVPVSRR